VKKAVIYNIMFEEKAASLEQDFFIIDVDISEEELSLISKNNLDFLVGYELGLFIQKEEGLLYFDYKILEEKNEKKINLGPVNH
jgi:hypothetical protein